MDIVAFITVFTRGSGNQKKSTDCSTAEQPVEALGVTLKYILPN
jgi:hypothetical protein